MEKIIKLERQVVECCRPRIVSKSGSRMGGVGIIIIRFRVVFSPLQAEALAAWEGLSLAIERGFAHVHRQGNGTAHRLARSALHMDGTSCSWFEEPSDFIVNLLAADCPGGGFLYQPYFKQRAVPASEKQRAYFEEIEEKRKYFVEIDAFELSEEEVDSVD
ncbi:hypothetical protein DVH24_022885 [Malus domestica]|uniref:RNase H type-1 domain-containing protein n=1 Tax=Malus domestica TaxID=3750 RepID=A0A498KNN8_MALDO|nr:hypothetical protein DVH24_022885 [Malus domestica]